MIHFKNRFLSFRSIKTLRLETKSQLFRCQKFTTVTNISIETLMLEMETVTRKNRSLNIEEKQSWKQILYSRKIYVSHAKIKFNDTSLENFTTCSKNCFVSLVENIKCVNKQKRVQIEMKLFTIDVSDLDDSEQRYERHELLIKRMNTSWLSSIKTTYIKEWIPVI